MPVKKEDRRVKYTKKMLKESLVKLMHEKDLSRITIKEICEEADINRATFYAHYQDPYDLLSKIEDDLMDNVQVYLQAFDHTVIPRSDTEWTRTLNMVTNILEYLKANASLCKLLLNDKRNLHFQKRIMLLVYDPYFLHLVTHSDYTLEEREYVYSFALTGCVGIVQTWLDNDMAQSTHTIAQLLIRLFYRITMGKKEQMASLN